MVYLPDFLRQYLLRPVSDTINQLTLAAGVAQAFTVPANATCVILSATDNFYALANGTAAIAAGNVTNGSGSELNPVGYVLPTGNAPVATISVICAGSCVVTAAFYS